ncbi:MAG: GntR family transcriptional regulator, partial [Phycisphaerae bacterium]|nr:GntR family transcriptional regulator [Phycisphaerae bacterium]
MIESQFTPDQPGSMTRQSKVRTSADRLREHILSHLNPGDQLPTEHDLSRFLDVGRNTVRSAIAVLLEDGWLKRNPRTRPIVSTPRSRPVRTSGLLCASAGGASMLFRASFASDLVNTLHTASAMRGRSVLHIYGMRPHRVRPLPGWSPNVRMVDSFLTLELFDEHLVAEATRLAPVICLDVECRLPRVSSLFFDQQMAVHMGLKYLYDLGHRRIAFADRSSASLDPGVMQR